MPLSLTERFPRAKNCWHEAVRPELEVSSERRSVVFVPRLQRKHPLKSKMSGVVF